MSKISNVLNMLALLKNRDMVKIEELCDHLEVSHRMVREYKNDLEKAGIYIESIRGKNGGYRLSSIHKNIFTNLTVEEKNVLNSVSEQLKYINSIYTKDFENIVQRINAFMENKKFDIEAIEYIIKDQKSFYAEKERKLASIIEEAITNRRKINIKYFSLSSGISERDIRPYGIFNYKGAVYFVGYCELKCKLLYFKMSRIQGEVIILDEEYEIDDKFSLEEFMKNNIGIYNNKEIKIKLKIDKPMSYIVSEKIWSEEQNITWKDDESIIFEASLNGDKEITSWILSMGVYVEVIEPLSLREEIKKQLNIMIKKY